MVDAITNSTGAYSTKTSSSQASADYETFLKLLTVQLENQDPLNPADGTEFTSQLAQFSALEQQIQTNTYLEKLAAAQEESKHDEAMSYLGKDVLVPGENFILDTTGNIEFSYDVDQTIESANVVIYNSAGEAVREFSVESQEGIHQVIWDGRDDEGNRLDAGGYSVKIEAIGIAENGKDTTTINLHTYFYGTVSEVNKLGESYVLGTSDGRYSGIETVIGTRAGGSSGSSSSTNNDHTTALQMLGKQILIPGSQFAYTEDESFDFTYALSQDVQNVTVTITDANGNRVLQKPFEPTSGSHVFNWDGNDANGNAVESGDYTISIVAQDFEDNDANKELVEEKIDTFFYGIAEKVEAQDNIVVVHTADGRTAYFDEIIATKN